MRNLWNRDLPVYKLGYRAGRKNADSAAQGNASAHHPADALREETL